jgi:hypothetical protein
MLKARTPASQSAHNESLVNIMEHNERKQLMNLWTGRAYSAEA